MSGSSGKPAPRVAADRAAGRRNQPAGVFRIALLALVVAWGCRGLPREEPAPLTLAANGVVACCHPEAARAGLRVLEHGGNAVDAAVAAGLALGVVDQFNSGIGGGGFVLIRTARGKVCAVDGREKAPLAARPDMFLRDGEFVPTLSRDGALAVAVPGLLAAYQRALDLAGTLTLRDLVQSAIELAEKGFALDPAYCARYREAAARLRLDPESARIYLHPDGSLFEEGEVFRQPDLARTLRGIAKGGTEHFYRGEFAEQLAACMAERGGLITMEDMRAYETVLREPVAGNYRGCTLYGMPPPSSGGVLVQQILNMLEVSGVLAGKQAWDGPAILYTSRFMARAFAERARLFGDSDRVPVPVAWLLSRGFAETAVRRILGEAGLSGRDATAGSPAPAAPAAAVPAAGHTTNLAVVDRWGNAVAINQTVNLTFGAGITVPGTGVILNNEMDDFSATPGVPNAFGLVGGHANAIEPGKRPLSSMAPTIVVRDGRPVLVLGGAGGPAIITAVAQVIAGVLDFGLDPAAAVAMPRFHHQYLPEVLRVESGLPGFREGSRTLEGVPVEATERLGVVHAAAWNGRTGRWEAVRDPRLGRAGSP